MQQWLPIRTCFEPLWTSTNTMQPCTTVVDIDVETDMDAILTSILASTSTSKPPSASNVDIDGNAYIECRHRWQRLNINININTNIDIGIVIDINPNFNLPSAHCSAQWARAQHQQWHGSHGSYPSCSWTVFFSLSMISIFDLTIMRKQSIAYWLVDRFIDD